MIEAAIERLNSWHQPQSAASMELLQLLFGKDLGNRERRIDSMPRIRKRSPVAIFAGIAVIGLIATVAVVLLLGSMRSGVSAGGTSTGTSESISVPTVEVVIPTDAPSSLPCTCAEDCSGVACITICADTNGERCVP
jgi:hypothetical protein